MLRYPEKGQLPNEAWNIPEESDKFCRNNMNCQQKPHLGRAMRKRLNFSGIWLDREGPNQPVHPLSLIRAFAVR